LTDFIDQNFSQELPKSKLYLYKYFSGKLQRKILRYYFNGGSDKPYAFQEKTGVQCSPSLICAVIKELKELETAMQEAKQKGDFSAVALLQSGKYTSSNSK
jgi:hypothetical protein